MNDRKTRVGDVFPHAICAFRHGLGGKRISDPGFPDRGNSSLTRVFER